MDTIDVYNGNSPADDVGVLTADHLTGLGMGGDTVIAGRTLPGGIVYNDIEVLNILPGHRQRRLPGRLDAYRRDQHLHRAGNDAVRVQSIDGHTTIDAGDGDDQITVGSDAAAEPAEPAEPDRHCARAAHRHWRRGQ